MPNVAEFSRPHPYPVVVMSFNRPQYLEETLKSLRRQRDISWDKRLVCLCQDGPVNFLSGERYADDAQIDESVRVFSTIFPKGRVLRSPTNVGIGLNFNRAEMFVFERKMFHAAMFFEDDMVLGPYYLHTMDLLLDFALSEQSNDRVGYVAAYGDHKKSRKEQYAERGSLVRMGHSWGFGLTRRHWKDMQNPLGPYLSMLASCDYRTRHKAAISRFYVGLGLSAHAMSQDAAKAVVTAYLNRARLMPVICQAEYIGRLGTNFTEEQFRAMGYGNEQLFPEKPESFDWPTAERLDELVAADRSKHRAHYERAYGEEAGS